MAVAQRLAATVALVRLRIGAEGIQVFQVALVGERQVVGVHAVFREQLPVGLDRMLEAAGDDLQFRLGLVADQVDIVLRLAQVGFQGRLPGGVVDEQEVAVDRVFHLCQGQLRMALPGMLVGGLVRQADQAAVAVVGPAMVGTGETLAVALALGADLGPRCAQAFR